MFLIPYVGNNEKSDSNSDESNDSNKSDDKEEENKSQPWYFHVVASVILVVHGLTFLGKKFSNFEVLANHILNILFHVVKCPF